MAKEDKHKTGGTGSEYRYQESVAILEFERELTDYEIDLVHKHRGFVVRKKDMVLLPWQKNPVLKMNQRQAETLVITGIEQKMPWSDGCIATVKYN